MNNGLGTKSMNVIIRSEKESDFDRITEINDLAFGQKNEGLLIEKLRKTKDFIPELSLIAEYKRVVIGHILFYPIHIVTDNLRFTSLSLAPLSVHPAFQNRGVGSKLVVKGLALSKELGFESIIVVGHAKYYLKFGFEPASRWGIRVPFDVPDEAFLAKELKRGALKSKSGIVVYPKEFEEV
jgi:putative acetyltransferase